MAFSVTLLIRCLAVAEIGHEGEEDVWHPCRYDGWKAGVDGEGGRHGLQHDVGEAENQTDAKVQAHSALALVRG